MRSGAQRREYRIEGRVVRGVLVDVFVAHSISRSDHERRPELIGPLAGLADPVAGPMRPPRAAEAAGVEQQPERVHLGQGRRDRRVGVVVDEHGEREVLLLDQIGCVGTVPGTDRHHLGAEAADLVVVLTQLRGVLPAEQSAEVAQEDQYDGPILPVVTEPMVLARGVLELDGSEGSEIHGPSLAPGGSPAPEMRD